MENASTKPGIPGADEDDWEYEYHPTDTEVGLQDSTFLIIRLIDSRLSTSLSIFLLLQEGPKTEAQTITFIPNLLVQSRRSRLEMGKPLHSRPATLSKILKARLPVPPQQLMQRITSRFSGSKAKSPYSRIKAKSIAVPGIRPLAPI